MEGLVSRGERGGSVWGGRRVGEVMVNGGNPGSSAILTQVLVFYLGNEIGAACDRPCLFLWSAHAGFTCIAAIFFRQG